MYTFIVEQLVAAPMPQIMRTCDADASVQLDAVNVGGVRVHFSPCFHGIFELRPVGRESQWFSRCLVLQIFCCT